MSDSNDSELPERDPDMPDDALGLGLSEPVKTTKHSSNIIAATDPAYRVLARKYRPQNFKELIGQDAMVQTLGNAIKRGRLAHAFLMTGVRGVGKTSTARLIAKALNCIGEDGQGEATINSCGQCEPCQAIAEGRHIDVIEMDAASNTGVDDVREIIEAVRYASVSARYKIYIIDEVHMLTKNAFNALLKTLEEPPAHVKFLFATTEVNKVPITVLSRCQRFDLKRISVQELIDHFAHIVKLEQVQAEDEALALIARSAEGSVRDGLSILDQAIAHADWANVDGEVQDMIINAAQVRDMLGLSDRSAIRTLLGELLNGDVQKVMEITRNQYQLGIEPYSIIAGLLREVHMTTLAKLNILNDPAMAQEAKTILNGWGEILTFPKLHKLWQLLLKGHEEIQKAAMPSEACDMALLRILHASQMPDPTEFIHMLKNEGRDIGKGGAVSINAVTAPLPSPDMSSSERQNISVSQNEKVHDNANDSALSQVQKLEQHIIVGDPVVQNIEAQTSVQPEPVLEKATDQHDSDHQQDSDDTQKVTEKLLPEQNFATHVSNDGASSHEAVSQQSSISDNQGSNLPKTFDDLIDMLEQNNMWTLGATMRDTMRLVSYSPPLLEYQLSDKVMPGFEQQLHDALYQNTNERWNIVLRNDVEAMPSQLEKDKMQEDSKKQAILEMPLVKAAMAAFPDAKIDENNDQYKRSIGR